MPSTSDIIADATWLPHIYDAARDAVLFAHVPVETRQTLAFLADHKPTGQGDTAWIAADEVRSAVPQGVPLHFIFHSAFCRSTLMVQAMGALDHVCGLSEPAILNTLQTARQNGRGEDLIGPVLRLLARPVADERLIVVKPSNFANGLIPQMLGEQAKGIVLYGLLRPFLRSIAKKGLSGRLWARKQMAHCQQIMPMELGMDQRTLFELTDMQAAALAWLLQINQFAAMLARYPTRLRSIETDDFIASKAETLASAATFVGEAALTSGVQAVADGALFAAHAKLGGDYEAIKAEQDSAALSPVIEEEIEQVAGWIEVIQGQLGLSLPLGAPLSAG